MSVRPFNGQGNSAAGSRQDLRDFKNVEFWNHMRWMSLVLALLASALLAGCSFWSSIWETTRPSVILILVPGLGFEQLLCDVESPEAAESGFQTLCRESVRFNHAYSPSSLIDLSLASILAGKPVAKIKFCESCGYSVSNKEQMVAEVALKNNYSTSFYSGGLGGLRRQGIEQGFEIFDDQWSVSKKNQIYRPALESIELWLKKSDDDRPQLTVFYFPDLIFSNEKTQTNLGVERAANREGQFQEIDESLAFLFQKLKESKKWDKTTIIFAGLAASHPDISTHKDVGLSGKSSFTRVPLLIKPVSKKSRDEPLRWRIDRNVSLYDIGETIRRLVGGAEGQQKDGVSLTFVLQNSQPNFAADRTLFISNIWTSDTGQVSKTHFIRKDTLLIDINEPASFYNSLIDPTETHPAYSFPESLWLERESYVEQVQKLGFEDFSDSFSKRLIFAQKLFSKQQWEERKLIISNYFYGLDPVGLQIALLEALQNKDWDFLRKLNQRAKLSELQYVIDLNLNTKVKAHQFTHCALALEKKSEVLQDCDSAELNDLWDWSQFKNSNGVLDPSTETPLKQKILRSLKIKQQIRQLERLNYSLGWLFRPTSPGSLRIKIEDLFLNLPRNKKLLTEVNRNLR